MPITAALVTVAALPTEVTSPVRLAFVVTVPALPVILVMVKVLSADKSCVVPLIVRFLPVGTPPRPTSVWSPVFVPLTVALSVTFSVLVSAMVSVAPAAGAVMANLFTEVAVATPISGVTRIGELSITNFDPVPVCEATLVALPTLVIGPVRLAFVVTVAALPVTLPAIGAVTVNPVNVPTEVMAGCAAVVTVPAVVAVAALPVVFWFRIGKSAATAIDGTPVPVVFFNIPVDKPDREVPLIFCTVLAPAVPVTSPARVPATIAFHPLL